MTYNWCHGPSCHTNETLDRVRGSKGNKVLRTRKIALKHIDSIIAIEPRREPLETPIKDPEKDTSRYYSIWSFKKREVDNT